MSFILLSHHRSGSSFMLDVIRHNPMVETINEPFSMHLPFFRKDESQWHSREDFLKATNNNRHIQEYVNELGFWLNDENYPKTRGFKETGLIEKYDWLKQELDFDNTLILVRDFRGIINSIVKRDMQNSWWCYRDRLKQFYNYNVDELDDIEICTFIVKERIRKLIEITQGNNTMIIKLENFLNDREAKANEIMSYIGLELSAEQQFFIQKTSKKTRDSTYSNFRKKEDVMYQWEEMLASKEIEKINAILKTEMEFFGYTQ